MAELRKKVLDEIDALDNNLLGNNPIKKDLKFLKGYINNNKDKLKNDQDVKIFLYMNKDNPAIKAFSDLDAAKYPVINPIITGKEPNLIKEDVKLKDIFGDTYLEPGVLDKMNGAHFKKLTDANNADFYEVLKAAEDEAVSKDREDAFRKGRIFGKDVFLPTNLLQQIFTPRTYESRMRGEDFAGKDLGLDIIENAAYTFLPGNILKYISKIPQLAPSILAKGANALINTGAKGIKSDKVAKAANIANTAIDKGAKGVNKGIGYVIDNPVTNFGAGAVTNPFMMEGLDALAYDDNESTDRKDFSVTDALIGSGINVGAPIAFRAPVGMVGRLLGGAKRGPRMSRVLNQLGEGKSISDMSDEAIRYGSPKAVVKTAEGGLKGQQLRLNEKYTEIKDAQNYLDVLKSNNANKLEIEKAEGYLNSLKDDIKVMEKNAAGLGEETRAYRDNLGYDEYDHRLLDRVPELAHLSETSKNIRKMKNYFTNFSIGTYKQKAELVDEVLKKFDYTTVKKDVIRADLLDILRDVKFDSDKAAEGYILSYVTNKYGDIMYGDKASSLPILGEGVKTLNELELSKKRQKVRDSFSKMLLPEVKPVKPDTTKGSN